MTVEILLFLSISVILSAGRNLTSKKTATVYNGKSDFYLFQTVLFGTAAVLLALLVVIMPTKISMLTCFYGGVYGVLLILSQWMFTLALKKGNTSVCSVIYSLGFILPTVSGSIFWGESFTVQNGIGIVLAVTVILLSAKKSAFSENNNNSYIPFILVAMLSSGGLGIMQKVQGKSSVSDEKSVFLLIAFIFAFAVSGISYLLCANKNKFNIKSVTPSVFTGFCFGGANLFNTILAGKMDSAVFFPLQNISTILLTTAFGLILFKEKITIKIATVLLLGILIIITFSI